MNTFSCRIALFALSLVASAEAAADFHVAPHGSDADPGTKDKPFATPPRAMAAVRALVSSGLKSDVHVVLRAGAYALEAPLVFTSADSGTADHAITFAAEPGATVVISGGREITNWTAVGVSKWTAELPRVRLGQWFFRQLIINDQRAVRARWPNEDGILHLATVGTEVKSFTFDQALPQESLAGQDAELVVYENWAASRALVRSSDQRQVATTTAVGWIGHGDLTAASPGKPAFIEHARFALDQPHEWFLDRSTGRLTYLAAAGEKPAQTAAVAPVLTQLMKIAGTKDKPVRNLHFEGLHFEHTDFPLPSIGYSEIQAAHFGPNTNLPAQVQPVAIECSYAEGIRFERCRFAHLNNSGIGFGPGCRRNAMIGCVIEDIGGNGVMVGWRGVGRLRDGAEGTLDADWADATDAPTGNEISNCVIQQCGADSRGAVGIFVAFSADTRVAHNVIHDLPYTGLSIGYRWDTTPTSQVRCVAEYNHIYDVMKALADGGGIYTRGLQPGTILRGNLIHDVHLHRSAYAQGGAPNNGFFIDEGSKGFLFESNVVHRTSGESVRFNQCQREWHTWKGNAFEGEATAARIAAAAERAGLERDPLRRRPKLPVQETDGVSGIDPIFREPERGDVRLQAGSGASQIGADALPPLSGSRFQGLKAGDQRKVIGIMLCWCPPGAFLMGSPADEPERRPDEAQVQVTLTKGFWIAKYETTQGDWKRVVGKLPGPLTTELPAGDDFPVGNVNFAEAETFCARITELARQSGDLPNNWEFRLPTEAQWEYACRAGTTTATAYGNTLSSKQANFKGQAYNGAELGPSLNRAARVGSYPPNAWGLHDMHGNTFEWCRDWYYPRLPGGVDPDLYWASASVTKSDHGGTSRVRRGGCWADDGWPCRSAFRLRFEPERRYDHIGFRIVVVQTGG